MINVDALHRFIGDMPGDRAEISKTNLQAIERELRQARAALAMARAERQIECIAETLGRPR